VANWLQAAWAVCFVRCCTFYFFTPLPLTDWRRSLNHDGLIMQTLQFFKGAEVILLINTINLYVSSTHRACISPSSLSRYAMSDEQDTRVPEMASLRN
jgi:hypothetical protein